MGFLRLGFVACLLSHAVLSGFLTAVAFIIGVEQLDTFLGFKAEAPPGNFVLKLCAANLRLEPSTSSRLTVQHLDQPAHGRTLD